MWEKEIWIAKRVKIETDEFGNEIEYFDKPIKYMFNYQPVSGNTSYKEYGEDINKVYRTFVDRAIFQGKIKTGDRVYLSDGELCENELGAIAMKEDEFCNKANYRVLVVLPQNYKMRIDFMKR